VIPACAFRTTRSWWITPARSACSPLEEARRERIEAQWRSPFIASTVPETAVRLRQQLGRLLRTDGDHGTATILDRRLASERWGGLLMPGLPDFELDIGLAGQ